MAWAGKVSLLLGFTLSFAPYSSAMPATDRQEMVYEVYAGGIHAVQGTLDINLSKKGRYDMVMNAQTRGFLAKMAPWTGSFESYGWRDSSGNFQPEKHQSTANWRNEPDVKEYLYNKDGTFKSLRVTDKHSKAELREVDPEVTDGSTDTLSATLQMLKNYNETGTCAGEAEVFDGKRRFKQIFRHKGIVDLKASKYNIYEGKAAECTVEVVPVSGEWHKKPRGWLSIQEQGRSKGTMPTVWIAKMADGASAIPVKVRVKTGYGTLFMHLAEYNSNGKTIVAEKRVKE